MFAPLALLLPFLGRITGRVWVYVALAACAASFLSGYWVKSKFEQAKQVAAVNAARVAERDAGKIGGKYESGVLARAREREVQHRAQLSRLRSQLASMPACDLVVPPEWVRQPLTVPGTPADPLRAESADPPLVVADARNAIVACERNRVEVYAPEADERAALRAWYEELRERYNRR